VALKRVNIDSLALRDRGPNDAPPGYRSRVAGLDEAIGASTLAGTLRELPPGEAVCPYHYEYDEEWMLVLDGTVVVRHPGGEEEVGRGELVCFPVGPEGAHKIFNRSDAPSRVLIVSTANRPAVAVYPDSDKIGVFFEDEREDLLLGRSGTLDYWDGERD